MTPKRGKPMERPILFSSEMVRAILRDENPKTQTRRVIKPQPTFQKSKRLSIPLLTWKMFSWDVRDICRFPTPYGQAGNSLWVRETFVLESWTRKFGDTPPLPTDRPHKFTHDEDYGDRWEWAHYAATDEKPELVDMNSDEFMGWKPSIHMPRWASRISLEVVCVRAEPLQHICDEDLIAEGGFRGRGSFRLVWDEINGKRGFGWDKNPWVWCVEFKRILQ